MQDRGVDGWHYARAIETCVQARPPAARQLLPNVSQASSYCFQLATASGQTRLAIFTSISSFAFKSSAN